MNTVKNIVPAFNFQSRMNPLQYWSEQSNQPAVCCSVLFCYNHDIEGGLVQRSNSNDKQIYIVPLCSQHRQSYACMEIGNTKLISIGNIAEAFAPLADKVK